MRNKIKTNLNRTKGKDTEQIRNKQNQTQQNNITKLSETNPRNVRKQKQTKLKINQEKGALNSC